MAEQAPARGPRVHRPPVAVRRPVTHAPTTTVSCRPPRRQAGHFCTGGAILSNPSQLDYGDQCPRGHYCEAGTHTPTPCPAGTYGVDVMRTREADCLPCPKGQYCNGTGLLGAVGPCAAGYYCKGGARISRPHPTDATGGICPPGYYCPLGSDDPVQCPPGSYSNTTGSALCTQCPAGYLCDGSSPTTPLPCPAGYYCVAGSMGTPVPCANGTYGPTPFLRAESECIPCPAGYFCDRAALTAPAGLCDAGYFCPAGSTTPQGGDDGRIGGLPSRPCPVGHYCPANSTAPTPCPPGTYLPATRSRARAECVLCDEGTFCADWGLPAPSGDCAPGHYCRRGVTSSQPTEGVAPSDDGSVLLGGARCPVAAFCPQGSEQPTWCPSGTYNNRTGRSTPCDLCPPGYFCPANSSSACRCARPLTCLPAHARATAPPTRSV